MTGFVIVCVNNPKSNKKTKFGNNRHDHKPPKDKKRTDEKKIDKNKNASRPLVDSTYKHVIKLNN